MEKRGLGRGLAALIPEAPEMGTGSQVREIPVEQIATNPYQPRTLFDPLKMEELVASIKEHGILQPVLVRRVGHDRYQLVAGERRFRAAQTAGLLLVPALVREIGEREQLEMAVVENVQREDIGVMEAARAYRRLIDEFGMTQDTVAQRVGKSRSAIGNTLRLLDLPEAVQESVERGELSEGHARALLMARDEAAILNAWQRVVKNLGGRLSVRETEKLAKEMQNTGVRADGKEERLRGTAERESNGLGTDPNEMAVADRFQQALGTKVSIRHAAGGAGRIEIEFYSRQDLQRLIELLLFEKEEA